MENEQKCDLCNQVATKFSSPIGNSDEPKLCDRHFQELIERGDRNGRK